MLLPPITRCPRPQPSVHRSRSPHRRRIRSSSRWSVAFQQARASHPVTFAQRLGKQRASTAELELCIARSGKKAYPLQDVFITEIDHPPEDIASDGQAVIAEIGHVVRQ